MHQRNYENISMCLGYVHCT